MSRVELKPKDPKHEVIVGLDKQVSCFFITVSLVHDEDGMGPIVFKNRWEREDVVSNIEKYAADTPRRKDVIGAIWLDLDPAEYVKQKGSNS